jgi:hypothetical protein
VKLDEPFVLSESRSGEDNVKRVSLAALAATMVVGLFAVSPANAQTTPNEPAYHEVACAVNALAPRVIYSPKRVQGRGEVSCTNSGSRIDRIVVWTFVQWFCCTETQIQTIALNKRTFDNVASGTTLRTAAARECTSATGFSYLFRTKVMIWVYDSYGDLVLSKKDVTPGGGAFKQLPCGDENGF